MLTPHEAEKVKKHLHGSEDMTPVFSALAEQTRCNIFRALIAHKKLCVSDVVRILGISMSSSSQHLKNLEINGLVTRSREGREIYFSPNMRNPVVGAIAKVVA